MPDTPISSAENQPPLLLWVVLGLAAGLRVVAVFRREWFVDELHALLIAGETQADFWTGLWSTPGIAPLDYGLVNLLQSLLGTGPWLRLPMVVMQMLGMVALTLFVARRHGPTPALITAALCGFSPLLIDQAASIRPYAGAFALGAVAMTWLWEPPRSMRQAVWRGLLGALGAGYQFFLAPVVLLSAGLGFVQQWQKKGWPGRGIGLWAVQALPPLVIFLALAGFWKDAGDMAAGKDNVAALILSLLQLKLSFSGWGFLPAGFFVLWLGWGGWRREGWLPRLWALVLALLVIVSEQKEEVHVLARHYAPLWGALALWAAVRLSQRLQNRPKVLWLILPLLLVAPLSNELQHPRLWMMSLDLRSDFQRDLKQHGARIDRFQAACGLSKAWRHQGPKAKDGRSRRRFSAAGEVQKQPFTKEAEGNRRPQGLGWTVRRRSQGFTDETGEPTKKQGRGFLSGDHDRLLAHKQDECASKQPEIWVGLGFLDGLWRFVLAQQTRALQLEGKIRVVSPTEALRSKSAVCAPVSMVYFGIPAYMDPAQAGLGLLGFSPPVQRRRPRGMRPLGSFASVLPMGLTTCSSPRDFYHRLALVYDQQPPPVAPGPFEWQMKLAHATTRAGLWCRAGRVQEALPPLLAFTNTLKQKRGEVLRPMGVNFGLAQYVCLKQAGASPGVRLGALKLSASFLKTASGALQVQSGYSARRFYRLLHSEALAANDHATAAMAADRLKRLDGFPRREPALWP